MVEISPWQNCGEAANVILPPLSLTSLDSGASHTLASPTPSPLKSLKSLFPCDPLSA